ncbi:glutamate mutase L [Desulfovibrio sp. OttesenSCG-928-I05]|nr:glutamate mutase L [Desulfovibrio sp. OttesenSCG-928-I05]
MRYLAVDFGSTFTKVTAIDSTEARILGTANAFTTITTDVMEGFTNALNELHAHIGEFRYEKLLCCSSAAGGLAMVAVGLVPDLTAKAARMAAEGAGAKVIKTFAYELSAEEQQEIYDINPDIVLLCGGTDGGNQEVITANAKLLAEIDRNFSIIVAGNKSAVRDMEASLQASGKRYVITKNVMPTFGKLDIEPAQTCIRDIFIERIIDAKGLSKVQEMTEFPIIPTPLAVLKGCELLSTGTKTSPGIGDFMAVDMGGATTDVYSMAKGSPTRDNVLLKGLPEPYAKRTVEGDLGMRYSLRFLMEAVGVENVAETAGVAPEAVAAWVAKCTANPETIAPENSEERRIDEALAHWGIAESVRRHCGTMETAFTPMGEVYVLAGKDMSATTAVVGVGGVLKNSSNPAAILAGAAATPRTMAMGSMLPESPQYMLDKRYIFSAMGLLSQADPETALTIMKQEISSLSEAPHGN